MYLLYFREIIIFEASNLAAGYFSFKADAIYSFDLASLMNEISGRKIYAIVDILGTILIN